MRNVASDEAFLHQRAFVAKFAGDIRQHSPQNFAAAPNLKTSINGFVVSDATVRPRIHQLSLEHAAGWGQPESRTSIAEALFRKNDAFPLLVCEPNHLTCVSRSTPPGIGTQLILSLSNGMRHLAPRSIKRRTEKSSKPQVGAVGRWFRQHDAAQQLSPDSTILR